MVSMGFVVDRFGVLPARFWMGIVRVRGAASYASLPGGVILLGFDVWRDHDFEGELFEVG